jgi:hypothetical protein
LLQRRRMEVIFVEMRDPQVGCACRVGPSVRVGVL